MLPVTDPIALLPSFGLSAAASRVQDYLRNTRAGNTRKAYASDWRQFSAWCRGHGLCGSSGRSGDPDAVSSGNSPGQESASAPSPAASPPSLRSTASLGLRRGPLRNVSSLGGIVRFQSVPEYLRQTLDVARQIVFSQHFLARRFSQPRP
jgi:hypothetical protein